MQLSKRPQALYQLLIVTTIEKEIGGLLLASYRSSREHGYNRD